MATASVSFRDPVLAWVIPVEDQARFRRILWEVLITTTVFCLALLWMPRPQVDRLQAQALAPRMAKLLIERVVPPPPPHPVPLVRPERVKEQEPAPVIKPEQMKSEPAKKEVPVARERSPQPESAAGEVDAARRKASGIGLLAMKDDLAELRSAPLAVQLRTDIQQGPGVGSGKGPGVGAGNEAGIAVRAMITSSATVGSGGISSVGYSRNTGGGGLAGRATTLVEGVAGGGGQGGVGGGSAQGGKGNAAGAGGSLQRGAGGKASRSIEEIKLVFERNKGAIYAIYNRALREDPSLQGKVVLELKIAPSGDVLECRIASSELRAPELEAKLLARIRQFDFGAKHVEQMIVTWPVDFLPS